MKTIRLSSRDAIIEAAFTIFNEKPGASLNDVAVYAGVGRATLHRHFSSRQDLIYALAGKARSELKQAIEHAAVDAASHTEGLKLSFTAIIPLASRQWFLSHELVDTDPEVAAAYQADVEDLHKEIEFAKSEGAFASDLPTKWIAVSYENLIYAAWTMVREEEATPNQAAELAWRIFMKGVSR